jgi:Spy/CpxP family protein refolding chaperone
MRTRNMVLIGLMALSLGAAGVSAQSTTPAPPPPWMGHHHGPPMMGGGPGRVIPLLLHSTDLTADQQTQVQQILESNRADAQTIFTQLRQANDDLATLLVGPDDVPADKLATQLAAINQAQLQLAQHEANTVLAIRGVLTADQLAKAAAAESQHQADKADHPFFMRRGR